MMLWDGSENSLCGFVKALCCFGAALGVFAKALRLSYKKG